MQLVVEPSPRAQHILKCKATAKQYAAENDLFVLYVRKGGLVRLPVLLRDRQDFAKILLNLFSEPVFLRYPASRIQRILHKWSWWKMPEDKEQKNADIQVIESVKAYVQMRRQPRIGVVVAFRKDGKIYIGWSLCKWKKGDQFDPWMGIVGAIDRAKQVAMFEDGRLDHYSIALSTVALSWPHNAFSYLPLLAKRLQRWHSPKAEAAAN